MIYDCFTFFDELDILEMRLNILDNHVAKFVLVEADRTFTNRFKRLFFEKNKDRFEKFLDRIIHIKVFDMPEGENAWERDWFQRKCIRRGLDGCSSDDIIMVSDADEIPNPLFLDSLWNLNPGEILRLEQRFYYYFLNVQQPNRWLGTGLARFGDFEDPNDIRWRKKPSVVIRGDTGWHFSFLGDVERMKRKIQSFSHSECNTPAVLDNLEERVANLMDIFGTHQQPFEVVDIDSSFPRFILDNLEKYHKYIFKPVPSIHLNVQAQSQAPSCIKEMTNLSGSENR